MKRRGQGREARVAPLGELVGPMVAWAGAAVLGSLVAEVAAGRWQATRPGSLPWRIGGVLLVLTVAVLVPVLRSARGRRAAHPSGHDPGTLGMGLVLAFAIVCTTAGGTLLRLATTELGVLPVLAAEGGVARVTGTVVAEPRSIATGWQVHVRVESVTPLRAGPGASMSDGPTSGTRERAALTVSQDPPVLGSRLELVVTARPLPPGGYGRWLERQHAAVVLEPLEHRVIGEPGRLARSSEHVRARVRDAAARHLEVPTAGLLTGFVTGDTRSLSAEDVEAMRVTGLSHLTAVSGSNVALLLAGALAVASACRVGARGRALLVAGLVPWFAFVTRFEPSVLRAGTMVLVLLLASLRGVPREARHALPVAVLALVLLDPRLAGSLGLLLSAVATGGVLVLAPWVRERLPGRLPGPLADVLSITIGAQLAVLPLLLATFGEVGVASVPANLVAVPAAGVAAALGFAGAAVALVHPATGAWVLAAAGWPTDVVLWVARALAGVGGTVSLDRPATVAGLVAACAWVLVRRRSGLQRALAAVVVVATLSAVAPTVAGSRPPPGFTVTAIDVGQGDAFLLETPTTRILVDAGEDARAAEWLRRNGRRRLDLLVISHPHLDHVGGVPEVLRRLDVGAVWAARVPAELPLLREVVAETVRRGVPVSSPVAGDVVVVGDVVVEVLNPPAGRPYRHAASELNEGSYVLRFHHDGRRVLTTGDVESAGQRRLLAEVPEQLVADVVTVPHHGSATTEPAFLPAVAPLVALVSVGADNRHGHPHPTVVAQLGRLGTLVSRTDEQGTITVAVPAPRRAPRDVACPRSHPACLDAAAVRP